MKAPDGTEIEKYLTTGRTDLLREKVALRHALVEEVRRRAAGTNPPDYPRLDLVELTRRKVEPMVRGLFPKAEQPTVLQALEGSVVLITPDSIEELIVKETWSSTAWSLANIYLHWLGLELLGPEATAALGQNEHLRCFITPAYFEPQEPLADFLVHEAAHVFHNCKRETLGLKFTRNREWLLPVALQHRERFALACEAYSRMCELGKAALDEVDEDSAFFEVKDLLQAASLKRNGWKEILRQCSHASLSAFKGP